MRLDKYSNPILNEQDLIDAIYHGHQISPDTFVDSTPATKNLQDSFEQLAKLDRRRNLDSKKIFTSLYKEHYHGKTI